MTPPTPHSPLEQQLRAATHARFFVTDLDGLCRGKTLSGERMADLLVQGGTIASAVFGWDVADDLYQHGVDFAGLGTALGEIGLRLDPATARQLPWDEGRWVLIGEHLQPDGTPLPICPRQVLQRVLAEAQRMDLSVQVGVEFEWFVLQETERSVRDKGFRQLRTGTEAVSNYSPFRVDAVKGFVNDLFRWLPQADLPLEALHTEAGPGNLEVALRHGEALAMADRAVLFKQAVREIGRPHGLLSTFMAKWSTAYGGCGQHLHQSLWRDHRNLFHDPSAPQGLSATLRQYIAGQLQALPELCALYAPFVNSYKRLVPGMLAPVQPSWGVDDRHAALRVVPGGPRSLRLETRTPGADANPYLALAAAIASGLHGIRQGLDLDEVVRQSAQASLPRSLEQATERLDRSTLARDLLGSAFVTHFVQTRRWECDRHQRAVTDWELARYLEVV
ncbi:glutamine synthetase family protein [Aquabacterium sp. A08]|uniref:glutamine synthetase family protein n=1 Tax=Aquabacterium sp. A08 TaxID=2718532 RepID=UPI001423098B|nr:glutamine synthetase family protein [Aquabacterium sp. A08]NIC40471.1 glutamine synthetase [Aquabacterium sp. A08]